MPRRAPAWTVPVILVMICAAVTGCREIDIVYDRSVFEPHRPPAMTGWGDNLASGLTPGDRLAYQGVYVDEPLGQTGLVCRFDRRQGWSHVILSGAIAVREGALVAVSGRIVTVERAITGTGRIHRTHRLKPDDIEVICDTGPARERARRIYARIRPRLQEHISMPGSRLVLAEEPRWRVDWLKGERSLVVTAHNFDMMYAAETQFLFSLDDQRLERIYFMEWFKGE